jgi:hypothetical protein
MRKSVVLMLLLAGLLTFGATSARAAGGACPTPAQYVNTANPTGPLVTLASLGVTSCYYIAASGLDSNAGTSEGSPWLHSPDMPNCASSCAAVTPAPGEGFIFRGGDTWFYFGGTPLIGLPSGWPTGANGYGWRVTQSGSPGSPIYWGADQTWSVSGAWTRPVISDGNAIFTPSAPNAAVLTSTAVASCTFPQGNLDNIALTGPSYWIFDNFEFTGMCWNDRTNDGTNEHSNIKQYQGGGTGSNPRWIFRTFHHGWTHVAFACPGLSTSTLGSGGAATYHVGDTFVLNDFGANAAGGPLGTVTGVSGGSVGPVTSYTITQNGTGVQTGTFGTTALTGSGTGFTIDVTAVATGTCNGPSSFFGSTQQVNTGLVMAFNVVDGSDSDDLAWGWGWGDAYDLEENVIRHVGGTAIFDNCHTIHDNLLEFINNSNDNEQHSDMLFCNSEAETNNFFYNNLTRYVGTRYNQNALSAVWWLFPFAGSTDYFFNNVGHDVNCDGDCNNLGQPSPSDTGSQILIYNNTWQSVPVNGQNFTIFGNAFFQGQITSANNHWISNSNISGFNCASIFTDTANVNGGVASCAGDFFQTNLSANLAGYTSGNDFAPISSSSPTVGAGANETSISGPFGAAFLQTTTSGCTESFVNIGFGSPTVVCPDVARANRPTSGACPGIGCWNAGAFNFVSSTVVLAPTPYAFAATVLGNHSSDSPVTFTLTNNTGVTVTGVAISFTGANAGDFSKTTSCGTTLASSASCQIFVTFTPTAAGSRTATLSVSDSDASSPQTSSLSGTAISSVINPSPANPVTFGVVVTDPSIPSTVKNEKHSKDLSAYNFDHVALVGFLHQDRARRTASPSASQ